MAEEKICTVELPTLDGGTRRVDITQKLLEYLDEKQNERVYDTGYLYHYTSLESFFAIINSVLDDCSAGAAKRAMENFSGPNILFHASDAKFMNDKLENKFIIDLFDQSSECGIDEKIKGLAPKLGTPYVISFCESRDSFPMWSSYSAGSTGICMKFNKCSMEGFFKKLFSPNCETEISSEVEKYCLSKCEYHTEKQIQEKKDSFVEELINYIDSNCNPCVSESMYKAMTDSLRYKLETFEYEQEHRLVVWSEKPPQYKLGRLGIVPYIDVPIPLESLKEVIIGPKMNQELVEYSLKSIQNKLKSKYGLNNIFRITKSNLKIQ